MLRRSKHLVCPSSSAIAYHHGQQQQQPLNKITPSPYVLFPYLESDWRQQIQREEAKNQTRETFASIQSATSSSSDSGSNNNDAHYRAILGADFHSNAYINRMLNVFSKCSMREELTGVLRHVKDAKGIDLKVFHFNYLFRCLATSREKEASLNLMNLMTEKEEVDPETVAIAIGAIHSWSGKNRFTQILKLIRKVHSLKEIDHHHQDNNNNNNDISISASPDLLLPFSIPWNIQTAWELSLFPRPLGLHLPRSADDLEEVQQEKIRLQHEQQQRQFLMEDEEEMLSMMDDEEDGGKKRKETASSASSSLFENDATIFQRKNFKHAPTLSALLHAVSNGPEGPIASLVVVCWMKAVGAELSAYDYFHILTAIARDVEAFSEIRKIFFFAMNPDEPGDHHRFLNRHSQTLATDILQKLEYSKGSNIIPKGCVTLQRLRDVLVDEERTTLPSNPKYRFIANAKRIAQLACDCIEDYPSVESILSTNNISNNNNNAADDENNNSSDTTTTSAKSLLSQPVYVGFLNTKSATTRSLDDFVELIFDEIHRRPTVGYAGESPVNIHHGYSLLLFSLRRHAVAVLEVNRFLDRLEVWNSKFNPEKRAALEEEKQRMKKEQEEEALLLEKKKNDATKKKKRRSLFTAAYEDHQERKEKLASSKQQQVEDSANKKDASSSSTSSNNNSVSSDEQQTSTMLMMKQLAAPKQEYAPSLFPGDDQNLKLNMWFPKDVGFQFPFVPRAILDRVRDGYNTLTFKTKDESAEVDTWTCWALGLPLLKKEEEIKNAVDTVISTLKSHETEKSVRQMIRSLLYLFASLPPTIHASKKYSKEFITKRKQWGRYYESRDTALALFGHTNTGREAMRRYYAETQGKLQAMRSEDVIDNDVNDVAEIFFPSTASKTQSKNSNNSAATSGDNNNNKNNAALVKKIHSERISTNKGVFGILPLIPHQYQYVDHFNKLEDESFLSSSSSSSSHQAQSNLADKMRQIEGSQSTILNPLGNPLDMSDDKSKSTFTNNNSTSASVTLSSVAIDEQFERLNKVLKSEIDSWFFSENDTAASYLRCLLHRYRWNDACTVAEKITHKRGFQAAMDAEIIKIFEELGDPAGAMCFKFACKFIDGRILEDRREMYAKKKKPALVEAREMGGDQQSSQ